MMNIEQNDSSDKGNEQESKDKLNEYLDSCRDIITSSDFLRKFECNKEDELENLPKIGIYISINEIYVKNEKFHTIYSTNKKLSNSSNETTR